MASFDRISSMEVDNFYPWLSDHCALKYSLSLNKEIRDNKKDATAQSAGNTAEIQLETRHLN